MGKPDATAHGAIVKPAGIVMAGHDDASLMV
jgi:hypothetical protein